MWEAMCGVYVNVLHICICVHVYINMYACTCVCMYSMPTECCL